MIIEEMGDIINDDVFLRLTGFCETNSPIIKIEGFSAGSSIKIKAAKYLIDDAIINTNLVDSKHFIESSSGNMGVALSIIAASKSLRFTCVADANTSEQNIKTMRALGAEVIIISQKDEKGGYLGNRLNYIKSRLNEDPSLIWLNQYANPGNVKSHYSLTAKSIHQSIGDVDYLVIGAGTTGTLMGCAEYFRVHSPNTKIIAVDSVGSVTFGTEAGPRYLPGLGASVLPPFFNEIHIDQLIQVSELEAVKVCREIAQKYGYLAGASTGTVLAGLRAVSNRFKESDKVVAISPDLGGGYVSTVFNNEWCEDKFGFIAERESEAYAKAI
ncbi:2,3-diaminopropionate biosynthesis protein SbnA [Vibrio caribbeanicus]|uniref:cysteine synthase n=1 Tax=Vibrio caribbeanicus ATCC BAA-2122 TaxID=796620 RepID=E3BG41_9VIBR|nr:2,3-diaminopropionate biosynthesis protein SbnA [Vibrio caribbeanicus]EFP97966.1 pyridoxal-5'-phosphate-dependent protein beta subunit [Vibrio caribbeanicus ATCC BAA-2122]